MGYMGHINCTDNFNKGLEKYDISARKSWSAINLFFNTAIDANNVATFDESIFLNFRDISSSKNLHKLLQRIHNYTFIKLV